MGFPLPSRSMTWASFHQNEYSRQEKQHNQSLGTDTAPAQVIAALSLLLSKFSLCQFLSSWCFTSCNIQLTPRIIFPPRFKLLEVHTGSVYSSVLSTNYSLVSKQRQFREWVCLFPWKKKSTQQQYSWILKVSKKKNKNPCAAEDFVKACFRFFPPNGELDEFDTFWQIWTFWTLSLIEHYEMFHLLVTFPYKHQKKMSVWER